MGIVCARARCNQPAVGDIVFQYEFGSEVVDVLIVPACEDDAPIIRAHFGPPSEWRPRNAQ